MSFEISKTVAANGAAGEEDLRGAKKILNRLGYYVPYAKTGMTEIPDADLFAGIRKFQKDQGLPATGALRPGDETVQAPSTAAEQAPDGFYIWRTAGDEKVRPGDAAREGKVFACADSPDPGEEFGCRCWAVPIADSEIQKEDLPPLETEEPKIPGTNIPDRGVPEQGWPGTRRYDPHKQEPSKNPDPYLDRMPPQSPRTPVYEDFLRPDKERNV